MNSRAPGADRSLARLTALTASAIFIELVFYSALGPLLPGVKHHLGLSTFQVGLLVAIYPGGTLLGVPPTAWLCTRIGVRPTTVLGLFVIGVLGALFAVAHSYAALMAVRLAQGVGAAGAWSGALVWLVQVVPRKRRGAVLGVAFGVSAGGSVAGPVVGAVAAATSRGPIFLALSCVAVGLGFLALGVPGPPRSIEPLRFKHALRAREVRIAIAILTVPALLNGATLTLGPLRLDALGLHPSAVGVTFAVAAALSMLTRPISGRWSDRVGREPPIRAGLAGCCVAMLGMAAINQPWLSASVLVIAITAPGLGAVPGVALLSDACERLGISQVVAAMLTNVAWQPGLVAGSTGAGAIAGAFGPSAAFVTLGAVAIAAVALVRPRRESTHPVRESNSPLLAAGETASTSVQLDCGSDRP